MELVDRLVAAISDTCKAERVSRDRLLVIGSPIAVDILKAQPGARALWVDRDPEWTLHKSIVGTFALARVAAVELPTLHRRAFLVTSGRTTCAVVAGW